MKIHLDLLFQLKNEARRKQTDLEKAEEQKTGLSNEKQEIAIEMTPLLGRLKEIVKVEDDFAHIKGELSM